MKCPKCHHKSDSDLFKCGECGEAFNQEKAENLAHLDYLLAWLDEQADTLERRIYRQLRQAAANEREAVAVALRLVEVGKTAAARPAEPGPIITAAPVRSAVQELVLTVAVRGRIHRWVEAGAITRFAKIFLIPHLDQRIAQLRSQATERAAAPTPPALDVVEFALESLPGWAETLNLPAGEVDSLSEHLKTERKAILQPEAAVPAALVTPPVETRPEDAQVAEALARELTLIEGVRRRLQGWVEASVISLSQAIALKQYLVKRAAGLKSKTGETRVAVAPPTEAQVLEFARESLPAWSEALKLPAADLDSLRAHLQKASQGIVQPEPHSPAKSTSAPEPSPVPAARPEAVPSGVGEPELVLTPISSSAPVAEPEPVQAKPKRPSINWGQIWDKTVEAFVSGALLRGLLYLGAFMVVVSALMLVVFYWDSFPPLAQLGLVAAVPAVFYTSGYILRTRLGIPVAGGVFVGIGALMVAVDAAAIYQIGGLAGRVDLDGYWLVASIGCALIYGLSAWRLPLEFFGYITLLAVISVQVALVRVLGLPPVWALAATTATGVAVVGTAVWLAHSGDRWHDLALAARRLPQILFPVVLSTGVMLFFFGPDGQDAGLLVTFLLASAGYGLLARYFPAAMFAHAAVWSSVGALVLVVRLVTVPYEWLAAAAPGMAAIYLTGGYWLGREQIGFLDERLQNDYRWAASVAGFSLLGLGIMAGVLILAVELWAGITALVLGALVLVWCSYLFRQPLFMLAGTGLLIVPFTVGTHRILADLTLVQPGAWLMTGWAGLALAYLGLAVLGRRAERYACWLNLWAHLLTPLAAAGLLANYGLTRPQWIAIPSVVALGGVMLVYAVSAVIHDSGRHPALSRYVAWLPGGFGRNIFLWPVGVLLPVWLGMIWFDRGLERHWLGATIVALGLAYVGLGQLLARRSPAYRLPPHVYAYGLAAVGIALAYGGGWALVTALCLSVAVLATLAMVYRRSLEASLAGLLFLWPFHLSLGLLAVQPDLYPLAYALLASLGYIPLGLALETAAGRRLALPQYGIGHTVAAAAVVASMLRFNGQPLGLFGPGSGWSFAFAENLSWLAVATPLVVTGLQLFSLYRFRQLLFGWGTALVFAITFGEALPLLGVPPAYYGSAWVSLALAYLLIARSLARGRNEAAWYRALGWPLGAGSVALAVLGLELVLPATVTALMGGAVAMAPLVATYGLATGLTVLMARLYRSRWPLYLEPWLAFVGVTLYFVGYGAELFGAPLSAGAYGLVWAGLGLLHLGGAAVLDRSERRYGQGLYLGGYAQLLLAIGWTVFDRPLLLWTLGLGIVAAAVSALLVHWEQHRSYADLMALIWGGEPRPQSILWRAMRSLFLFIAVYAFPVWLVLLLGENGVVLAWQGVALALLAPLYVAAGLAGRRLKAEYGWPFFSAGYTLTAIGALVAFDNELLAIYVLALNTVVYAASAYIFRQAVWLYLSNILVPVVALLLLRYNQLLDVTWVAVVFMGLAFGYVIVGQLFDRFLPAEGTDPGGLASFSVPFYIPGYLLSILALVVASGDRPLALGIDSAGVVLYGASAWVFREPVFLYPAAWLAVVPYYLAMTLSPLPVEWYGLCWFPLIVSYVLVGRLLFQQEALGISNLRTFYRALGRPAMPFYLMAYGLSVMMIVMSAADLFLLSLAFGAAAALYLASTMLFRQTLWLYPGLAALHLALVVFLKAMDTGRPVSMVSLPLTAMTWLMALLGTAVGRFRPAWRAGQPQATGKDSGSIPRWTTGRLETAIVYDGWARPFLLFALFDLLVAQFVTFYDPPLAIAVAAANALLLGLLAVVWVDRILPYGALAFVLLAAGFWFDLQGLSVATSLAIVAGIGFGFYLLALAIELLVGLSATRLEPLAIWYTPLLRTSVALCVVAVAGTLPFGWTQPMAAATALGFSGALCLTIAFKDRVYLLGYLGVALLLAAWSIILIVQDVNEPQWYAIPAGLYLMGVGYLARRHAPGRLAMLVEGLGVAVLLLTSFIQSLDPDSGFVYFLLLLVEALLVIWWGAGRRLKVPFFAGLFASVLNVMAQVIIQVSKYEIDRWVIIFGVGLLLVSIAVYVERQRTQLLSQAHEWREALATWH